jgi:YesN/AraC family two-component response regulator
MPVRETSFRKNLPPVQVEVLKVTSLSASWNDNLICLWVVGGKVDLYEAHLMYHLNEGDIFVINYNEPYKLISKEGCICAFTYFDIDYFKKAIPNLREVNFAHYYFSKSHDLEGALENIYRFIESIHLMLISDKQQESTARKLDTLAIFFLKVLVDTFQYSYYTRNDEGAYLNFLDRAPNLSPEQMQRLQRLTYHIWTHSAGDMSLDDLAETEFYSRFYVSHFIRKAYGLSFQETVSLTRVVTSERLLIDTNDNLEEIATQVGFSNRSQYCDLFKKWHGMPPSQYRKENKPGAPGNTDIAFPVPDDEASKILRAALK